MRYSLNLPSFVKHFVLLGKSIFLHFRSNLVVFAKICENFTLIKERIFDEMGSEFVRFLQ
ncbi:hypothetical protein T07_12959 [Trichinella nelsoni]|uniref:Uncharacterized protein n=1 Tax=Trichinella nelsoni TaxID=6336 RepID=A0A0V0RED5_9BILA|nr:hypothetical protein T07_12959 [Trichinella nelsoni]